MAVGDAKQVIYRWRGGDMDQIPVICTTATPGPVPEPQNGDLLEARYDTLIEFNAPTSTTGAPLKSSTNNNFFQVRQREQPGIPDVTKAFTTKTFKQATPDSSTRNGGHTGYLHSQRRHQLPAQSKFVNALELYEGLREVPASALPGKHPGKSYCNSSGTRCRRIRMERYCQVEPHQPQQQPIAAASWKKKKSDIISQDCFRCGLPKW